MDCSPTAYLTSCVTKILVFVGVFTLTGCGGGGMSKANSSMGTALVPTLAFSAMPAAIITGRSATLSWTTTNATALTIDNGIGPQQNVSAGSVSVSPSATTTYTATAAGTNNQSVTQKVTVTVSAAPPPTLTFTAMPSSISQGGSSTLSWRTTNANSLTIDQGVGPQQNVPAGSVAVFPTATTTYTAIAAGVNNETVTEMATVTVSPAVPQQAPVIVVMEENHGYDQVIAPNSPMPFLNSLAQRGALLTQYFADAHPSLPNYLELTSGAMEATDDNFAGVIPNDNLAREFAASAKTWKVYAEDLPSPGYLGGDVAHYLKHHNPFAYYSDVVENPALATNLVPFTQFAADLNTGALPQFSFVVPDALDDAHSCPEGPSTCSDSDLLSRADQWLSSNIGPLLSTPQFQNGGLLLVLFDEANDADTEHGGGRVALIAVGSNVVPGFKSAVLYQHENTLRTICDALGLQTCPGAGATAAPETDMFLH